MFCQNFSFYYISCDTYTIRRENKLIVFFLFLSFHHFRNREREREKRERAHVHARFFLFFFISSTNSERKQKADYDDEEKSKRNEVYRRKTKHQFVRYFLSDDKQHIQEKLHTWKMKRSENNFLSKHRSSRCFFLNICINCRLVMPIEIRVGRQHR